MSEFLDTLFKIAGVLDTMFFLAYIIRSIIDHFTGGPKDGEV